MKLIVGLGNPGLKYEFTRHNVGFLVIDACARDHAITVNKDECHAQTGKLRLGEHSVMFVKPQTFMNRSGVAVAALQRYYRVSPENILVVYDDLDLPPGHLRLRAKGGAGGHNGMRSVIDYLRTTEFPRLRVGIGAIPAGWSGADYVLAQIPRDDTTYAQGIERAANAVLAWVEHGLEAAMQKYNQKPTS